MSESKLFPEKELIDVRFLELIKYDDREIVNKEDVDKAIREYSHLVNAKKTKLIPAAEWEIDVIEKKREKIENIINEKIEKIQQSIEKYYHQHMHDVVFLHDDDVQTATIELEHGQIIFTQKTNSNIKIKPKKEKK